jgi:hypothetical protein
MTSRTYTLTAEEALLLFSLVRNHNMTLKNWTASAVEDDDFERAKTLTKELRQYERLYSKLNVEVHQDLDR